MTALVFVLPKTFFYYFRKQHSAGDLASQFKVKKCALEGFIMRLTRIVHNIFTHTHVGIWLTFRLFFIVTINYPCPMVSALLSVIDTDLFCKGLGYSCTQKCARMKVLCPNAITRLL